MVERAAFALAIDLDGDGVATDVTASVDPPGGGRLFRIERGASAPSLLATPKAGAFDSVLLRSAGSYGPGDGTLVKGRRVTLTAEYAGSVYTLWGGRLGQPVYPVNALAPVVEISALGPLAELVGSEVDTPLYEGVDTGAAIHYLLDAARFGLIETGARNLVSNPRGGAGATTGWAYSGSAFDAVTDSTAPSGTLLRLTAGGTVNNRINTSSPGANATTLAQGTAFSLRFSVRAGNAAAVGESWGLLPWEGGGASPSGATSGGTGPTSGTLTGEWQEITREGFTIAEVGRTSLELYVGFLYGVIPAAGAEIEIADVMIVEGDEIDRHGYFDGDTTGPGYSWEGAVHESASARAAGEARDTSLRSIDTGKTTLTHYWERKADALSALLRLRNTEGPGASLYEHAGAIVFKHRHARVTETRSSTSQATFSGDGTEPLISRPFEYEPYASIYNSAEWIVRTRAAGSTEVVWSHGGTITLYAGESIEIIAEAATEGGTNEPPPLKDVSEPVEDTDYTVAAGAVTVSIGRTSGARIPITITATADAEVSGLQLRAKRVLVASEETRRSRVDAAESIEAHGLIPWEGEVRHEISATVAQSACDAIVGWHKGGRPTVSFGLLPGADAARMAQALARQIGDRITVDEGDSGVSLDAYIEGVVHELDAPGLHRVTVRAVEALAANYATWESNWDGGDLWAW